tara:strand:+ start:644 stop:946 length:303 start_codon:yes stop_codon:yes gene_type:complete
MMDTYTLAMLGWMEISVIVFFVLLLFGAKKLPELARGMGKGIREFKRASSDIRYELEKADESEEERPRPKQRSRRTSEEKPAEAEVEEGTKSGSSSEDKA